VSELARRTRLTVRTLHHYDRIGLVRPSRRSAGGYRLYAARDLGRLEQVLFFRELGFALEDIRKIMNARAFERQRALAAQRALLVEKAGRVRRMIETIDQTLAALTRGEDPVPDEKEFDMFGDFEPKQYEDEVKQRWGNTDAYRESQRRTKQYGPAQWKAIKAEAETITRELADRMAEGTTPDAPAALALAERHRLHMDRWFYPVSHAMHVKLAEMYVSDPRFTATYDDVRPGLARYIHDAIQANAKQNKE